jgi:tRNA(fMet)-specific endonuclease VapC
MKYMLDTNAISSIVSNPQGPVLTRMIEVGEANVFTSIFVHAEVWYGVKKKGSADLAAKVRRVTERLYVAPFQMPGDARYGDIRLALRQGRNIGPNDLWIAAHALALDAVLVTDNEREFSRVPGLKLENWVR